MALFRRRRSVEDSLEPEERETLRWLGQQGSIGQRYARAVVGVLESLEVASRAIPRKSPLFNQPPATPGRIRDGQQGLAAEEREAAQSLFKAAQDARTIPGLGWQKSADLMRDVALRVDPNVDQGAPQRDPRLDEIRQHMPGLDGRPPVEPENGVGL